MSNNKVRFVVATYLNDDYNRINTLKCLVWSLLAQTYKNIEIFIHHDGPLENDQIRIDLESLSPKIKFIQTIKRLGFWGHMDRRNVALLEPKADWIVFTNDDNYYVPIFTWRCLECLINNNSEMVWCNMIHSYFNYDVLNTSLAPNQIDCGAFMTSAKLIEDTPWPCYEANSDSIYASELCRKTRAIKAIGYLFVHN